MAMNCTFQYCYSNIKYDMIEENEGDRLWKLFLVFYSCWHFGYITDV